MLDFNGLGIKGSDDLQEALKIEHSANEFCFQFQSMVDRWGLKDATEMLAYALCGNGEDISPLIKFTKKYESNPNDLWDEGRLVDI